MKKYKVIFNVLSLACFLIFVSVGQSYAQEDASLLRASRNHTYSTALSFSRNIAGQNQTWKYNVHGNINYNPNTGQVYNASVIVGDLDTSKVNNCIVTHVKRVLPDKRIGKGKVEIIVAADIYLSFSCPVNNNKTVGDTVSLGTVYLRKTIYLP